MKLKPCPFCGAKINDDSFANGSKGIGVSLPIVMVECGECSTLGADGETKEEAIEKWNTRNNESIKEELIEVVNKFKQKSHMYDDDYCKGVTVGANNTVDEVIEAINKAMK